MARKKIETAIEDDGSGVNIKEKAYELMKQTIRKQFGNDAILEPPSAEEDVPKEWIGSGCLSLDLALGYAFPRGRIVEIYGPESNGKTTVCLEAIVAAQQKYPEERTAIVDAEFALDIDYGKNVGIDFSKCDICQPTTGEEAIDILATMVRSGLYSIIVIDSVAALVPAVEVEASASKQHMGTHARLMSSAMRKLVGAIHKSNTCVVFTNQIRMKIGVMFGNPETTTGGNALKFYATQRLDLRRIEFIKDGTGDEAKTIGIKTRVKCKKNKVSAPDREVEISILYGKGIDKTSDILDKACELGVVEKSGTWYSHKDERLGQGKNNAVENLNSHPEWLARIKNEVLASLGQTIR